MLNHFQIQQNGQASSATINTNAIDECITTIPWYKIDLIYPQANFYDQTVCDIVAFDLDIMLRW
jgi:hypothetical protein